MVIAVTSNVCSHVMLGGKSFELSISAVDTCFHVVAGVSPMVAVVGAAAATEEEVV